MPSSRIRRQRERLVARDGPQCFWCGVITVERPRHSILNSPVDRTADHIVPVSKGGSGGIDNLVLSCRACNQCRKDRSAEEFMILCRGVEMERAA